jgi:ADP-L-glycero-D-manno-heptose 6-epimerase
MKAIVTGGAGFVGSNLALALEEKGAKVIVVDDFCSGDFHNLAEFRGDVIAESVNTFDWNKLGAADVVFHEAALTDTTIMDQRRMVSVNVEGFRKALDYSIKHHAKLVYASTAALYGNSAPPQEEEKSISPLNIYAFSKLIGDHVALEAMKEKSLHIVGLRYFNVFGPHECFKGKVSSMIFQLAEQMRQGKRPRIFLDGEQKRDHIYVKDVVRANLAAFESKKSGIVNVGTGIATSFNRLIEIINDALGTNLKPDYFENPYGFYQNHTQADTARAKKIINFSSIYTIEEGIQDYLTTIYQLEPKPSKRAKKVKLKI